MQYEPVFLSFTLLLNTLVALPVAAALLSSFLKSRYILALRTNNRSVSQYVSTEYPGFEPLAKSLSYSEPLGKKRNFTVYPDACKTRPVK